MRFLKTWFVVVEIEAYGPVVQDRYRYFRLGEKSKCSIKEAETVVTHREGMLDLTVTEHIGRVRATGRSLWSATSMLWTKTAERKDPKSAHVQQAQGNLGH